MSKPDAKTGIPGRFNVQYSSFPNNYNATLEILDTDYDNYAVIVSCSRITALGHTG